MLRNFLIALLVTLSASAHAGYYAYLISSTSAAQSLGGFQPNAVSGCASSVLEAIQGVVDPTPPTTDRIVYLYSVGGGSFSGSIGPNASTDAYTYRIAGYYATCTDVSSGGIPARLSPGLTDPTPQTGTGTGTGTNTSAADIALLTANVTSLTTQVGALSAANSTLSTELGRVKSVLEAPFDLTTALSGTAFFYSTVLFFYAFSKAGGAVLSAIRYPTRRH